MSCMSEEGEHHGSRSRALPVQLVNIPVWSRQRIFREERAALIANDIK